MFENVKILTILGYDGMIRASMDLVWSGCMLFDYDLVV